MSHPGVAQRGGVGLFGIQEAALFGQDVIDRRPSEVERLRDDIEVLPGKTKDIGLVPWCTFADPELAHAGPTVAEAVERHGQRKVEVLRADLSHSDRARADGSAEGRIVLVAAGGKLVGAHILAPAAGELIHELALAIRQRLKPRDLGLMTHVYPTIATSINVAGAEAAYEYAQRFGWLVRREKRTA